MSISIPGELRPYLRIGTCSWKYDSWKGLLYDEANRERRITTFVNINNHFEGSAPLTIERLVAELALSR